MNGFLAQVVAWLNGLANVLGRFLLVPIGVLPGWLSATLVGVATGVLMLVAFKYTSNQRAIRRVKDDIKAQLLALKLFKDSTSVTFKSQGRVLIGASRLLILAIVPTLVMIVPISLVLSQLALWYQSRPLRVGEEAVLTLQLNGDAESALPDVRLEPEESVEVTVGPVRAPSQRTVFWRIKARQDGQHHLAFHVGAETTGGMPSALREHVDATAEKELAIGDAFMRVSVKRPGWNWLDILLHPAEKPYQADSLVQSIEIDYPQRLGWTSGTDTWVIYWLLVSMVAAFCLRPVLNVNF